ncbi:hypothetical protein GCM10027293_02540 [Pontibacter aydingkolensis]
MDNPVIKAALERAQNLSATDNARISTNQTIRVAQTETYATWREDNQWVDEGRINYTFNTRGQIETATEIELPANVNSTQYTYVYNSQGIPTELISKEWVNSAWVNAGRLTIEFEDNLLKSFGMYVWSNNIWVLMLGERSTFTKLNGRVTETVAEVYSAIPGAETNGWELSERIAYSYTGSDNRPTGIITYSRQGTNWVEQEKETAITYVGSTYERSSYFLEEYDRVNSVWNKYKYEYQYSQDAAAQTRTIVETEYNVEGTTTTPNLRTTTTDLTSGEPYVSNTTVRTLIETYEGQTNSWVRDTEAKATVTRDSSGDITQIIFQEYSDSEEAFVNTERFVYSNFTTITVTSAVNDMLAKATEVYPNPVQNSLRISLDAAKVRNANLNIYSLTGQKVFEQHSLNATTIIDVSKLPAGVYMVRITDDNNANVTRRIVKQ